MVVAAAGSNSSEELMKFAANLTIDKEEFELFGQGDFKPVQIDKKVAVNAQTQEAQAQKNYEAAADRNSMDMLAMFGMKLSEGKPGHD